MKSCLICEKPTEVSVEIDISVGLISSNEPPICRDCYESEEFGIIRKIAEIEKRELPF